MHQPENTRPMYADDKAIPTAEPRSRRINPFILAIAVAVAALSGGVFFTGNNLDLHEFLDAIMVNSAVADSNQVAYPIKDFSNSKARYYKYDYQGKTIKYFIVKSSDGVVRAAFDACDVCWPAGKGYAQDDDVMVCRNCGRRFASSRINEVKGGCNPAPLKREVQGDQLVIEVQDILEGQRYFK